MTTPDAAPQASLGRQVAEAIAKANGGKVETISVKMVGTKDVQRFIRRLQRAQQKSGKCNLKLD